VLTRKLSRADRTTDVYPITTEDGSLQRYQIALEPGVAEKLRELGGDNLSRGIALAAQRIKERAK
jgi:hypothetical protein